MHANACKPLHAMGTVALALFALGSFLWLPASRLAVLASDPWSPRLLTHLMAHVSAGHLATNLIALISVGPVFEKRYGTARLVAFFAAAGAAAALCEIAGDPSYRGAIAGCSGAVAALIGGSCAGKPAALMSPLGLAYFAIPACFPPQGDSVAHIGHLGGFVLGLVWAAIGGVPDRAKA